ncbi:MAG: hypothetical protein ACXVDV_19125, partial [Bacteroidia bacterium]
LFVVGLRQGDDYLNDSFTASGNPATTMTMALHGEYDPEYILKYRWRHNLMATQTGVFPDGYIGANKVNPLPPPPRIFVNNDAYFFESPEPPSTGGHSYKVLYTTSRPTENVPGLLPPDYSIVAVFITEQQFNLIINNNSTAGGSSEFKNKTLFSSGVNKRKNFPKKYVFILKHNTGTTLDNFTGLRLDWMGINVSLSGTEALQTDYNSDGYPTNELPWKVDTLNASDSYLHPPGTTSFPSINYKSSLFERKNISILNNGWLPEDTKLIQQLGDLSTSQKVFNVCIGGKREPYISSIDGQTRTEGEELILIHNLMLQLAAIDLTLNPMTPARTQPLTDTVTQLAAQGLTPIQIRQIRNVLRLFDGDSDTRTLNKAKRQTSTTGYGVDGFSDLGADNNIVGETSGESIWNKRGSYFEVDNTRNEQLYQWRLNNTLQANAAATNVIIKRRLGSTPSAPGNPGNFPSDFEVIYKICTSSVTHLLGPNNDFTSIKEVTFKLIYTEYKNREFIINVYGIGN